MNLPEVNLTELHKSIAIGFKKRFPDCIINFYSRPGEKITTPAIFFELEDVCALDTCNIGTEQLDVKLQFSANVVVSYKRGGLLGVRMLSLGVASFVHGARWGQPVGPGQFTDAVPEEFSDSYESWRVSWTHTGLLGKNIWEEIGNMPESVGISAIPQVGIPYPPDFILFNREEGKTK